MKNIDLRKKNHLSWRESQVIHFCIFGLSPKEMAHASGLSLRTIEGHMKSIQFKWNVSNKYSIILEAIKRGNIDKFLAFHSPNVKGFNNVLSRRQVQVLKYLFTGSSYLEVAMKLSISVRTVETHLKVLKERLNLNTAAEIVYMTIINGYVVATKREPMRYELHFIEPVFEMKENYVQKYDVTDKVVSTRL